MILISFDPDKRNRTLAERGLDFADSVQVFEGPTYRFPDDRRDYAEERTVTVGYLDGRMVVIVWTPRGAIRHIISMRKANDREQKRYRKYLD
jgi:uncharacterized DUF497 family protein